MIPTKPIRVFVSYSRADRELKDQLLKHLGSLRLDGRILVWEDGLIEPGVAWSAEIDLHLHAARLVLLLVSPDFLSSSFCHGIEMKTALQRHAQGQAKVVPIILRHSDWKASPLSALQILPRDERPVCDSQDRDQAFASIAEQIRALVDQLAGEAPARRVMPEVLVPRRFLRLAGLELVFIPGGTFLMGSGDHYPHERPKHSVAVSPFFLGMAPVTNRQFARFVGETGYRTSAEITGLGVCNAAGRTVVTEGADWRRPLGPASESAAARKPLHPVVQVSWFDASAFAQWASRVSGADISLPTEAQWEFAAAGEDGRRWPFGDVFDAARANVGGTDTSAIGTFAPTGWGAFDLAGNVYEWCADWYASDWQSAGHSPADAVTTDPKGPPAGTSRVLKGGSWLDVAEHVRCANRFAGRPDLGSSNWGMRCALRIDDALLLALSNDPDWGMAPGEIRGASHRPES